MTAPVVLDNGILQVTVAPGLGGTILALRHLGSGLSVLGQVPWQADLTAPTAPPMTEVAWLKHYSGGWPILFPNGGEACTIGGVAHGFHGEGSVAPWQARTSGTELVLSRRFDSVPVVMQRRISLHGAELLVVEQARALAPCRVIWGAHVTFGSDLLDGAFHVETIGAQVSSDKYYDPPGCPLLPGQTGPWPILPGPQGTNADLSRPAEGWAALAYLSAFTRPEITIARDDGRLAAMLSWDGDVFDCLWYWIELGATDAPPWAGRTRLVGIEPCSTPSGLGLARALERGDRLVSLEPDSPLQAAIRLRVFA